MCQFDGHGPQRSCSEDYPDDLRVWCASCLISRIQADEHAYRAQVAELLAELRDIRVAASAALKGGA